MSAKLTKSTLGSDANTADVLTPTQPGELKTTEFFAVGSLEDFSNDPRYLNIDLRKIATTKIGKVSQTIAPFKDLVFSAGNQVLREIARLELVEVHLRKSIGWTCDEVANGCFRYDLEQVSMHAALHFLARPSLSLYPDHTDLQMTGGRV